MTSVDKIMDELTNAGFDEKGEGDFRQCCRRILELRIDEVSGQERRSLREAVEMTYNFFAQPVPETIEAYKAAMAFIA